MGYYIKTDLTNPSSIGKTLHLKHANLGVEIQADILDKNICEIQEKLKYKCIALEKMEVGPVTLYSDLTHLTLTLTLTRLVLIT